ncbi:hypothetical protein [Micromonospora sp. RV43]|uniref:hypothetical protein n=1 Tax=Micromonospora sp. RV43 TaxID=1661387 RepID=UPI00064BC73B|nr:hypothetical protein [Micromonospora sp. RV43]
MRIRDYGTHHPESEALLAIGAGDEDTATQVLGDMSGGELAKLVRDGRQLVDLARQEAQNRG